MPLSPASSILDDMILALLLTRAAGDVWDDPDVSPFRRLDALGNKIGNVREMASALRLFAVDLATETHPDTVRQAAATAEVQAAASAAAFKDSPISRSVLKRLEAKDAAEALEAAERDLAAAKHTLGRMTSAAKFAATAAERVELTDNVNLAKGAVEAGERRLAEAVAKVAAAGRVG